MVLPKKLTTVWARGRKFSGYFFDGKVYKTKFFLNRAIKNALKKQPKRITFTAKPVYAK